MTSPTYSKKTAAWYKDLLTGPGASLLLAILLALSWAGAAIADISPYEARYSIYRNGKLIGMLEIDLKQDGDAWEINSKGSGTHGLARILRARDTEKVTGRIADGRYLPDQHVRHTRVVGLDDHWKTTFDWENDQVTVVEDGKKTWTLPLGGEALDPLSMKLEMRQRLEKPEPDLVFMMVDEDEIEEQRFRLLETEWLETSLGCMETTPIEKIRKTSSRYTRAWHAPAFGNIEVRVEHGKTGGDHMEMRITELSFGGEEILARPGCSAQQSTKRSTTAGDS